MHRHRYLVVGMIFFLLTIVGVERTEATAFGLPDGNYEITVWGGVPSPVDPPSYGTMTIGATDVEEFHLAGNPSLGVFDCSGCSVGSETPDRVPYNAFNAFEIVDTSSPNNGLGLETSGCPCPWPDGHYVIFFFIGWSGPYPLSEGEASAIPVPEPQSLILFLSGIAALVLRVRMHRPA
jgi:hypothetical protein